VKRGQEDLDFFIGDEALTAAGGPGKTSHKRQSGITSSTAFPFYIFKDFADFDDRLRYPLPY
jgi:hypothetical protein